MTQEETNEILQIADDLQQRIHKNVSTILKEAEKKGNNSMVYSDAYNTALIIEIASIIYDVKS